jgi:hypothetical protein
MKKVKNSRALAPLSTLVVGTMVAGAVAIGHTWADALVTEVIIVCESVVWFVVTGRDSDVGAIYGQRTDERQQLVRSNASRLALLAMFAAGYVCALVAVAQNASYWQSAVIVAVGGVTYLVGIRRYGVHDESVVVPYRGVMESGHSKAPEEENVRSEESETSRGDR